jgi:hypothetical protein
MATGQPLLRQGVRVKLLRRRGLLSFDAIELDSIIVCHRTTLAENRLAGIPRHRATSAEFLHSLG